VLVHVAPAETLEDREHERRGLARARTGAAEEVASFEQARDRFRLDRSRTLVALLAESSQELLDES
jgi:hypothetical protein